ncbi:DNA methyltransferase [Pantoea sp. CCBC3-3-1]|uniref:DNA methyltransferase n=1 Tax=Pantoea sp. CCBC3-3-1 TaxID=2490851 RepID=UPI00143DDDEB|nr:DNA methyltransferase [Pantoea sp. CCBC3-3-1]
MEDVITIHSRKCDVIADFFKGSGSIAKAAVRQGRKAMGIEFKEAHCEPAKREIVKLQN